MRVLNGGVAAVTEVADAGPGLSDEQLSHAFERFYRGDRVALARRRRRRARPRDHRRDRRGRTAGLTTVVNEGRDGGRA